MSPEASEAILKVYRMGAWANAERAAYHWFRMMEHQDCHRAHVVHDSAILHHRHGREANRLLKKVNR